MKKFRVTVFVYWKKVCVDPSKKVILEALQRLNPTISGVEISRRFILAVRADDAAGATEVAQKVTDQFLANHNIEDFEIAGVEEVIEGVKQPAIAI